MDEYAVRPIERWAFVLGLISLVLGGLFPATADGGHDTGNGVVAPSAAIVLGPIAIILVRGSRWLVDGIYEALVK